MMAKAKAKAAAAAQEKGLADMKTKAEAAARAKGAELNAKHDLQVRDVFHLRALNSAC
eukprot:SAG11_NODE_2365_length_3457_cov_1.677189_4_plen_58_part_00